MRLETLIKKETIIDITEKKPIRTIKQNSYLWLILSYWGTQTGYTKDEAETIYKHLNKDIYYREKEIAGVETIYIRHTYELDTLEMTQTIDKFRDWAAMNGIYIPTPDDLAAIEAMQMEVERNRNYL